MSVSLELELARSRRAPRKNGVWCSYAPFRLFFGARPDDSFRLTAARIPLFRNPPV